MERAEIPSPPEVRTYTLPSTFQRLPIQVRETLSPGANRVLIYAHGSFDHMDGHWGFYTKTFKELAGDGLCSIVQVNTARRATYNDHSHEDALSAFEGKTLQDEAADYDQVIERVLEHLPDYVVDPKTAEVILVGLSLGGTMMTLNAHKHPRVNKLMLISSGARTRNDSLPMMNTYPPVEEVKEAATQFRGMMLHVSPRNDDVVPIKFQDELRSAFKNAWTKLIDVPNADHVLTQQKPQLKNWILDFVESHLH